MQSVAAISFLALALGLPVFTQEMPKGFEHFYNLEYDQAVAEFRQIVAREPENPHARNHVAQAVLYREMLRAGALESELVSGGNPFIRRERVKASSEATKTFNDNVEKAMSLAQALIAKNPKDTGALYALGVSHGLRANYKFLVEKAWKDALKDATAARTLHNQIAEIDPNLTDAKLIQGVHDYVVGSLPWHWKILGFIAGFRGDREAGIKTLQEVARTGKNTRYDAQVLLAAIYRREREPQRALPLLDGLIARFPRNYLFRLETVQMYSDAGDKEKALAALDSIDRLKRSGSPGAAQLPMEKIHYYRGNLLFWYRDLDRALVEMQKAAAGKDKLDLNTATMTLMRLGQINDMKGRRNEAIQSYKRAIESAPESNIADESRKYMSSPYKRVS